MAKTSGHGNPDWTRDETLLALNLYFDLQGQIPSGRDPRIQALSEFLQKMPYHAEAAKVPSFRNPDGVAFKLQNIRQVATGKGLGNTSRTDRAIWDEFGSKPDEVRRLATAIHDGISVLAVTPHFADDMDEFPEGRILTELHKRRERDRSLRKKLLARRATTGLSCDLCGLRRPDLAPSLQAALFEAHHVVPLGSALERITRIADLALLCACCHRLVHALISTEKRWFSISEACERLSPPPSTC